MERSQLKEQWNFSVSYIGHVESFDQIPYAIRLSDEEAKKLKDKEHITLKVGDNMLSISAVKFKRPKKEKQ